MMQHIFKSLGMLVLSACTTATSFAVTANQPTHEYKLKNGLTLIVREDHRAPAVVSMVWYKVGSGYEPAGITGISHALEHMMFKGTPLYKTGEFSKIIASKGGEENAFTNNDYTAFHETMAKSQLPTSFQLEAARMQNLQFKPEEFNSEIKVVKEERRMRTDDSPQGITVERFMATANLASPYQHPVIGWMNDLNNLTMEDVKHWYQTWYTPNNATLVVVGDVDPQAVLQLAEQYFGAIPKHDVPVIKPQHAPPSLGQRRVEVEVPAKIPMLIMGYNVPSLVTAKKPWEPYALEVLAEILGGGDSARLQKELVHNKQYANEIAVDYDIYDKFDTLFTIYGIPTQQHTVKEVQQAISDEINRLQHTLISDAELQRVKNQTTAEKIYEQDSIIGQATQIGLLASVGLPWQTGDDYVNKIKAVTPQQVQEVAQRYLTSSRLTVAELKPLPMSNATAAAPQIPLGGQVHEK